MLALPPRYEFRQALGEGGMGQVVLAFDRDRNAEVALKVFMPASAADEAEGRFLFKQEFWAMASLRHPHLVAAFDYGELEGDRPYFTMEPVPGIDLAGLPQDEAAVRAWLPGIAGALGYLHGRGFVHGDLKPENIRLLADGTPKLMDLGLLERVGRTGGPIRGSLAYMAPETIRQGAIDGRADLYALGAVMYEALAGQPPFVIEAPMALLRAHLDQAAEPLRRLVPGVSRELEAAVMRLLAKRPAERFASANDLLMALNLGVEESGTAGLLGAPLVGRDAPRAEIEAFLAASRGGQCEIVGPAGAGKSRLLAEARASAQLAGRTVLDARGLGASAVPYQALAPWLSALARARGAAAKRLAPVLARVVPGLPIDPAIALEGAQERVRLHAAVAELARDQMPGGVWLLDDADALDEASRELVAFLTRQAEHDPEATGWHFLFTREAAAPVADLGPEEAPPIALPLAPLSEADTLALARALLGQEALPEPLVERLHVLSGGLPGGIEAVLGHWLRCGALAREGGCWVGGAAEAFELPGGWQVALDATFEALGADARQVGRVAALWGASGAIDALAGVLAMDERAFFGALAALEAALVLVREEGSFRFARPAQAQALASGWDERERRAWHSRAARWLVAREADESAASSERRPLGDVLAIASHHLAGETPAAGVPWAIAGARRALEVFALTQAERLLAAALALPALEASERLALEALLANGMRLQTRTDEALARFEHHVLPAARALAAAELADCLVTYGVLLQLKGRYVEALAALAEGINEADGAGQVATGVRARLYAGRVAFFAGETRGAMTHLASAVRRARQAKLSVLLAGSLGFYGFVLASSEPARASEGLALLEEAIALSRDAGDLVEAQEASTLQGNVLLAAGRLAEARAAFEACLQLCGLMGTASETLFALLNLAAVELELGELAPARSRGRQAIEMSRRQARQFPEGGALAIAGLADVLAGELGAGVERLDRALAVARDIRNRYLELNVLVYRVEALLHLGRFEAAREAHALARQIARDTQNDEHAGKLARFEAVLAFAQGAPDARAGLQALADAAQANDNPLERAHALRWLAEAAWREGDLAAAREALDGAIAPAREAGLGVLLPELSWLAGCIALAAGQPGASVAAFEDGLSRSLRAGFPLGSVLAEAGLGAGGGAFRHRQAARDGLQKLLQGLEPSEQEAYLAWPQRAAVLAADDAAVAPQRGDDERLHHLTDLIAMVSAQPNLDDVMDRALRALVELADAERGFLLLYQGFEVVHQVFFGMQNLDGDAFSSSLAYQVLWSGEPVFVEDAQADSGLAGASSVQALALRSAVGVPLFDGEEVLGVMIADSRHVTTAFGPQDLPLALALARQVAIAITGARRLARYKNGYEELESLHRLALQTVGARTLAAFLAPVARAATALVGAERAFLLAGESLGCLAAFDAGGRELPGSARDLSHSVGRWVFEHGEPLHLHDAQTDAAFQVKHSVQALGLRTIFAVPVAHGDRRLGVLYLDSQRMLDENSAALHTLARMGELVGAFLANGEAETHARHT